MALKSKSQERREAVMNEGNEPEWKKAQQKQTKAKNNEDREAEVKNGGMVKVKMKTNYRDVAKTGDEWECDSEKADELVRLGRAEYI